MSSFGIQFISILFSSAISNSNFTEESSKEPGAIDLVELWLMTNIISVLFALLFDIAGIQESSCFMLSVPASVITHRYMFMNNLFLSLESGSNTNSYSTVPRNQAGNLVSDLILTMVCGDLAVSKLTCNCVTRTCVRAKDALRMLTMLTLRSARRTFFPRL